MLKGLINLYSRSRFEKPVWISTQYPQIFTFLFSFSYLPKELRILEMSLNYQHFALIPLAADPCQALAICKYV